MTQATGMGGITFSTLPPAYLPAFFNFHPAWLHPQQPAITLQKL